MESLSSGRTVGCARLNRLLLQPIKQPKAHNFDRPQQQTVLRCFADTTLSRRR